MLEWTGERYLPQIDSPAVAYEHMHRYAYISEYVQGKWVLDLACGEGYGSALLARTARSVVGIDINIEAIRHARIKYKRDNLEFVVGTIVSMPVYNRSFDVIVCFEAIEHILEQEELLSEAKRLLSPDGIVVISTPNRPEYRKTEPPNPFHVKEFDFSEFEALLLKHFKEVQLLGQRVYSNSSLWPLTHKPNGRISEFLVAQEADQLIFSNLGNRIPIYLIGFASNAGNLPILEGSVLVDSSNALVKNLEKTQHELEAKNISQEEALAWREEQVQQFQATIYSQQKALSWREEQVKDLQEKISFEEQDKARINEALTLQKQANEELTAQLRAVEASLSWRLIQKFVRIRDITLPSGSYRRKIYDRLVDRIKSMES